MEHNAVIEVGSKVDIIIRFNSTATINGKQYAAEEPFLLLKEVNANIIYDANSKTSRINPNQLMAFSDAAPRGISIRGYSLSRKILGLIASYAAENVSYQKTTFKTMVADRPSELEPGLIFLTEEIPVDSTFFVYDSEFNSVEATYVSEMNALESLSFVDGNFYLVSFSPEYFGTKFTMKKPCVPYMSLEIQGKGNINKIKKDYIVKLSKVSLESVLDLSLVYNGSINVPLDFAILQDSENYIIFED
jgi:hypothetical protein